jgi:hypothetical protein
MDKIQKPNNSECYTSSSEPFRIYVIVRVGNSHHSVFILYLSILLPWLIWYTLAVLNSLERVTSYHFINVTSTRAVKTNSIYRHLNCKQKLLCSDVYINLNKTCFEQWSRKSSTVKHLHKCIWWWPCKVKTWWSFMRQHSTTVYKQDRKLLPSRPIHNCP